MFFVYLSSKHSEQQALSKNAILRLTDMYLIICIHT